MADFPLDFPVVFTVSIIMNRLRYIIELSNCVLLWFEKNFASDSSHCWSSLEQRQSNVMSMATITIDYYKAFGLTKSPLFGVACIDQVSSYSSISLLIEND